MPRKPRLDYPGATHHAFTRGAARAPVFLDDEDKVAFLETLERTSGRFQVRVQSYALMTTHFHLGLFVPRANLSAAMQYLLGRYARRFNDRHGRDGSPFRGRFANRLVETEDYLRNLFAYIHLNPVRAGMARDALSAAWTSHAAAVGRARVPPWLDCSWVDSVYGGRAAFQAFVDAYDPNREPVPPDDPADRPDTAVLATPGSRVVVATSVAEALSLAGIVTGTPRSGIRAARGHVGEFVAWALVVLCGLDQPRVAALLRITKAAAGQRIRRFEAWADVDPVGATWRRAVLAPPGKVVGL